MFVNEKHSCADQALKDGKVKEAIKLFDKALELNPNHPDIYSDRGVAHLRDNNKAASLSDFKKALELQPDYSYRYAALGFAENHFGDVNEGIRLYKKAVELDPDDAVTLNNLGLLLEQKGYNDEAKSHFDRADNLSKQEDHLLEMMEEMEGEQKEDPPKPTPTREKSLPEVQQEDEASSVGKEFGKIFTSWKQFKEFMSFVKNGFKIK